MTGRQLAALTTFASSGALLVGCTETVPPPRAPVPHRGLDFPAPAGDDEASRVFFETDVPARIERLTDQGDVVICERTPCSAPLAYGDHRLRYTATVDHGRTSVARVKVEAPEEHVSHTLGQERTSVGTMLGTFTTVVGFGLMLVPVIIAGSNPRPSYTTSTFVGAGMVGVLSGISMMALDPNLRQEGATTQWRNVPAPLPAVHGPSLMVDF